MKKKIIAVLTAVMMLSCTMTALAAPSVTTDDIINSMVTVASDVSTAVQASNVSGAKLSAISTADLNTLKAGADVAVKEKGVIKAAFELTPGTATKGADGKYTVTVTVPTLTNNAKVVVLHLVGGIEVLSATTNGKAVTFKTATMSPFAIVELASNGTTSGASTGTNPVKGDDTTSPKTGVEDSMSYWPIVAIICLAGLGVLALTKKNKLV